MAEASPHQDGARFERYQRVLAVVLARAEFTLADVRGACPTDTPAAVACVVRELEKDGFLERFGPPRGPSFRWSRPREGFSASAWAEGKIYGQEKVPSALENFFTAENLTTLRELALREVASSVDRTREEIVRREEGRRAAPRSADRIMVAMSSDPPRTASLLRRASRIAGRLNSDWYCVYVQTPDERADRIDATVQRRLVDNIQRAQSMGAVVVKLEDEDAAHAIRKFAHDEGVRLIILGSTRRSRWHRLLHGSVVDALLKDPGGLDILIVDSEREDAEGTLA